MSKKSAVEKNGRRKKMAIKYAPLRAKLRETVKNTKLSEDERLDAQIKLQKLPRNGSWCRVRSRCYLTGRPRGNLKKFGISRIAFRELASQGKLPGIIKASW